MNIAYVVTENWLEKVKPSIRSLKEHNPEARVFLVTDAESTDIDAELICVKDQEYFTERNCINYRNAFTYMALMKVVYPELLPVDKVIHLDVDTIIADSLEPLWETELNGKWFGMVREAKGHYRPFGEKYYNSGVFIADLKQIRKDGIMQQMIDYICRVSQPWGEQDAFNKYGIEQDKIVEVDVRFNEAYMTGFTEDPAIVHYAGITDWWSNGNISRADYLNRYR